MLEPRRQTARNSEIHFSLERPLLSFKLLHFKTQLSAYFKRQLSALIRLPVQVDKIASSLALGQYFSR